MSSYHLTIKKNRSKNVIRVICSAQSVLVAIQVSLQMAIRIQAPTNMATLSNSSATLVIHYKDLIFERVRTMDCGLELSRHVTVRFSGTISQSQKYNDTLCLPSRSLGTIVCPQKEIKATLMHNFVGTNKEYYGIFDTG